MKFSMTGKEIKIKIDVIGRIYSNGTDYWDSNWVRSQLHIEIPGYLVHFEASLRTEFSI